MHNENIYAKQKVSDRNAAKHLGGKLWKSCGGFLQQFIYIAFRRISQKQSLGSAGRDHRSVSE